MLVPQCDRRNRAPTCRLLLLRTCTMSCHVIAISRLQQLTMKLLGFAPLLFASALSVSSASPPMPHVIFILADGEHALQYRTAGMLQHGSLTSHIVCSLPLPLYPCPCILSRKTTAGTVSRHTPIARTPLPHIILTSSFPARLIVCWQL